MPKPKTPPNPTPPPPRPTQPPAHAGKRNANARETARQLYLAGRTFGEIAKLLEVNPNTLTRWADEGKWKELRVSLTANKEQQIIYLLAQLNRLNEAITTREEDSRYPTAEEANTIERLTRSMERLAGEMTLSQMVAVVKRFTDWMFKAVGMNRMPREEYEAMLARLNEFIQDSAVSGIKP